ncbi:demethylrebeccamycin-D-glucose O-methyltransferase [Geobacter sp. OR-1]|uniref:class I SAM-dependent methyltransferase n=1 Tax=Geobacter sp. OR-1 TaxID=1266765 RepID=UPI000542FA53|nr:class I SAM-dependent methyltransferase [Geobacter sp. OR-1]GAM10559.1 demethylrebeccamycin-D-glucose O-methyltransferase [Geobacter sp. OR-1]
MNRLMEIVTSLHRRTERDYLARMQDAKVDCMRVANRYGADYWDGDRRYGYGGFRYDGRWKPVAEKLIATYSLQQDASILDVGCGKGFLLYELQQLLPQARVAGFDISAYAIANAKEEIHGRLAVHRAQDHYPFRDKEFDLVISLNTLHNLHLPDLQSALSEMERVGKDKYLVVEAYRNEEELFNLQCWALTCAAFFTPQEWQWLFNQFGYGGDYEFIYFE